MSGSKKVIEIYKERTLSITEALNTLSMHYTIEIKRVPTNESRGKPYEDVDYFVDSYLKEYYKNNSQVIIR